MNNLIKNLDEVLEKLNDLDATHPERFTKIFKKFPEDKFTDKELHLILNKLYTDDYVQIIKDKFKNLHVNTEEIDPLIDKRVSYAINYNGVIFYKQGGYKTKRKYERIDNRRKVIVDFALIFGSACALVAAIVSLYNLIHNTSCC